MGKGKIIVRGDMRDQVVGALRHLTPEERAVLETRFGLPGRTPRSLRVSARLLGLSTSTLQRREKAALARVNELMPTYHWLEFGATGVPMERWGKDHWSTFAYAETCAVDRGGHLSDELMRGDGHTYPTRLRDGLIYGHSDWECLKDIQAAGLITTVEAWTHKGRVIAPDIIAALERDGVPLGPSWLPVELVRLTDLGWDVARALRAHKAAGRGFGTFTWPLPEADRVAS